MSQAARYVAVGVLMLATAIVVRVVLVALEVDQTLATILGILVAVSIEPTSHLRSAIARRRAARS